MHKQATRAFPKTLKPAMVGAKSLPQKYFVSPDVFADEQHKIFSKEWLLIGHQSQLPGAGEFFVVTVADESLIVVRDQQRQIRAFYNVCRHRGSRLKEEACGHTSAIQCPYHAWTYALDGRLMGAPHMDDAPGFDKADYSLAPVNLGLWEGFIFVNLGKNPEPLEKWFAPLSGKFSHWNVSILQPAKRIEYDVHANWKLMFENYSECYHCPGVHPRSISRRIYANQSRQESHHERKCVRGIRRKDRKTTAGILLLDFPQHATEPAPGIHHGASALAAITGADAHCV